MEEVMNCKIILRLWLVTLWIYFPEYQICVKYSKHWGNNNAVVSFDRYTVHVCCIQVKSICFVVRYNVLGIKFSCRGDISDLLRNGWIDLYQILCAYWVGLRIGQHLFVIALNDKGEPHHNIYFYGNTSFAGSASRFIKIVWEKVHGTNLWNKLLANLTSFALRLYSCTAQIFNEVWHGHTLIDEEGHGFLSIAITNISAGGAASKS